LIKLFIAFKCFAFTELVPSLLPSSHRHSAPVVHLQSEQAAALVAPTASQADQRCLVHPAIAQHTRHQSVAAVGLQLEHDPCSIAFVAGIQAVTAPSMLVFVWLS